MQSLPQMPPTMQVLTTFRPDPDIVGPMFVGILVLFVLFGVLSVQIYIYGVILSIDRGLVRALVYGIYALLLVQVIMCGHDEFLRFTARSPEGIGLGWFFVPVIGGIVTFSVQVFYAWRISFLSGSKAGPLCLIALSSTSAIAAFVSASFGSRAGSVQQLGTSSPGIRISSAIWFSTSAVCDLAIAGYMIYLLTRSGSAIDNTKGIVGKVIRLVIESNALTATLAVVTVALLLGPQNQTYFTVSALILPSIYGNSLLVMMNLRFRSSQGREGNSINDNASIGASFTVPLAECSRCSHRLLSTRASSRLSASTCQQSEPLPPLPGKDTQSYDFQYSTTRDLHLEMKPSDTLSPVRGVHRYHW
ncbi:hypothetical protein PM082_015523 [Marasmius tenuissimus]|nr:hypothetical protein PM082_015523 [Marasmius tenuissimus]